MNTEKVIVAKELANQINNTSSITVFVFCFSLILFLLIYIWKDKERQNDIRHKLNEDKIDHQKEVMNKLIELQQSQQVLLAKFEAKFESLEK